MSSRGGGWISKKTRGQDDDQIEHDAAQARLDRINKLRKKQGKPLKDLPAKKRNTKTTKTMPRRNNRKKAAGATRKKKSSRYEDDEDYSEDEYVDDDGGYEKEEDDFIVDDDDEEEDEDGFNSDELPSDDEESLNEDGDESADDQRKDRELEEMLKSDNDDESSDDEDEDFLIGKSSSVAASKRRSKPSSVFTNQKTKIDNVRIPGLSMNNHKADQAKKRRMSSSSVDSLQGLAAPKKKKTQKSEDRSSRHMVEAVARREADGDSDDDEVEIIDSPPALKKPNGREKSNSAGVSAASAAAAEPDNEDDYDDIMDDPVANPIKNVSKSPFFQMFQYNGSQDSTVDTPNPVARSRTKVAKSKHVFTEDESDDEDNIRLPRASKKKGHHDDFSAESDEDEDERMAIKESKKSATWNNSVASANHALDDSDNDGNDFHDEDLNAALKASMKTLNKKKQRPKKLAPKRSSSYSGGEENPLELSDDSSDDDDDGGDAYVTKEQKAAREILKTAEQLSTQVCTAMREWTDQTGNSGKSIQGIITDGAVTLGAVNASAVSENHEWITSDTMKQICPEVKLADYQLVGVNWMALLNGMSCEVGTRGKTKPTKVNGVLADEMGLGKTVQTISFLAYLKYRSSIKEADEKESTDDESLSLPHLIVVPVSVLKNWMNEFKKFCPDFHVVCYHGSMEERENMRSELEPYLPKYRNKPSKHLDCIVAPSTYFSKESSDDRRFLCKFRYNYLVVDEAHILKSSKSMRYIQLQKVKSQRRLLLTGTPVQNTPRELLNMLSFLMPLFSKPGSLGSDEDTSIVDDLLEHFVDEKKGQEGDESQAYKKLKQVFAPFVLRRKKDDVLTQLLTPKQREVRMVEMDPEARQRYESIIHSHINKNGSKVSAAIGEHLFTNLRKAAHHSLLLRNRHNTFEEIEDLTTNLIQCSAFRGDAVTRDKVKEEISRWNDFTIHSMALDLIRERPARQEQLQRYILEEDALFESAKFIELKTLVPDLISKGHRILIFSSWTSILDILECLMNHIGLKFLRMDGSTPGEERQQRIDRFNTDRTYNIFLLSTKACGLGINLTSADTCIIHDLDFNPFNDLQAEDRCHRIGQKKTVTVYKLVTKNTVDEDIYNMQERKVAMNAAIMESSSTATDRKAKQEMIQAQIDRIRSKKPDDVRDKENDISEGSTIIDLS